MVLCRQRQRGIALVVSLLFLLMVTLISIAAARNSSFGLRMAGNMQDAYDSFQAAEAGVYAVLGLAGTGNEPFRRVDVATPFAGISAADHPLQHLRDGAVSVNVAVFLMATDRTCPRPPDERDGSSVGLLDCDYYRITAEHDVENKARSRMELGVVKTVIGSQG